MTIASETTMHPDLDVRLEPLPHRDVLRARWRDVERRSRCSFFLSWRWIGTWLELICEPRSARLLSVQRGSDTVALGVVTARRRFRGFGPLHLRLHETGNRALDNLTIEYNGLISEVGFERSALNAAVSHLARSDRRWLTLHMPGVDADLLDREALGRQRLEVRTDERPAHFVDLSALRAHEGDYLSLLDKNTRGTIRRTDRRLVEEFGPVQLDTASTAAERQAFLDGLMALHDAHWSGRGTGGAFTDARIVGFHRQLAEDVDAGSMHGVQMLRLRAGDHVVGYVYNIVWRERAYYYQAGIDYARFGALGSPGLLLQALAIDLAAAQGLQRYEFMAGDAPYKRRLSTSRDTMSWMWIDRPGWASRIRRAWRRLARLAKR